jgi:hypothetical protein
MVERAVSYSDTTDGWDPFATDTLDVKLEESHARSRFDGVSSTTLQLGVPKTDGDNSPAAQDAVKLYKAGVAMMKISDSTGLSTKQIRKALKVAGVKRSRRKKVESADKKVLTVD